MSIVGTYQMCLLHWFGARQLCQDAGAGWHGTHGEKAGFRVVFSAALAAVEKAEPCTNTKRPQSASDADHMCADRA